MVTSPEARLFSMLSSKDTYQKYRSYLSEYVFSKESAILLKYVDSWYRDNKEDINWGSLRTTVRLETTDKPLAELLDNLVVLIEKAMLDPQDPSILDHFAKLEFAGKISDIANNFKQGYDKDLSKIVEVGREFNKYLTTGVGNEIKTQAASFDAEAWKEAMAPTGGIDWGFDALDESAGPLRKGNFVVVAARPETGKTSFALDMATNMAKQMPEGRPVLFFHNEEAVLSMEVRAVQAAYHVTTKQIMANPDAAIAQYKKDFGDRLIIWPKNDMTIYDCERAIAYYNPGLIIYNVMPKIQGFTNAKGATNDVARLAKLFQWGRDIAIDQAPSIALMQAGAATEGKQWIYQSDLHGNKTDVAGEGDLILTIGKNHDTTDANIRYFLIAKNKLLGGPKTDPSKSHAHFPVYFDRHRCKFSSMP